MSDKTVGYCLGRMITALQAPLINSEVVSEALSDLVGLINASEAREAKLREALVRIVALADLGDCITSFRRAENAMDIARAALGEGKP